MINLQPSHKDVAEFAPPLMVAPAVLMPERAALSELEKALLSVAPAPQHTQRNGSWRHMLQGAKCLAVRVRRRLVSVIHHLSEVRPALTSCLHLPHQSITLCRRRTVCAVLLPLAEH